MNVSRRATILVLLSVVVGAPAVALRALCVGRSCENPETATADAPFCSLPEATRRAIEDGFRENRSPEIVAVTKTSSVAGGTAFASQPAPGWPSLEPPNDRVPLAFFGDGINAGATVSSGTSLDAIAPTVSEVVGLERPHPEVRSGTALAGISSGGLPRLVVEIVLRGVGSDDFEVTDRWRYARELLDEGAGTLAARVGSVPLDPAAVIATIGTGALPRQHGITGTMLRNDDGALVRAWSKRAPVSVVATLGDDLDELGDEAPMIGLVATDVSGRGLIGGDWYVDVDRDDVVVGARDPVTAVRRLLSRGYGGDGITDLLAIVLDGEYRDTDEALRRIVDETRAAAEGAVTFVLAGTGALVPPSTSAHIPEKEIEAFVSESIGAEGIVEATAPGGLYLNQVELADQGIDRQEVLDALIEFEDAGTRVFADAFSGIAVTFARYC